MNKQQKQRTREIVNNLLEKLSAKVETEDCTAIELLVLNQLGELQEILEGRKAEAKASVSARIKNNEAGK